MKLKKSILLILLSTLITPQSAFAQTELFQIPLKTIDGQNLRLEKYKGSVLLIVNTASQCGYTPQYQSLETLYEKYSDRGLVVLGFPSNDFGKQEPGSNAQIKLFCKGTYHVSFPMFEKASVSGPGIQPLFAKLVSETTDHSPVEWNFEKFLIGRDGKLLGRFRSAITPDDGELVSRIKTALGRK